MPISQGWAGTAALPLQTVSVLEGIGKKAAGQAEVLAKGCVVIKNRSGEIPS